MSDIYEDEASANCKVTGAQTARLLERTARAIYDERGPSVMHPGQWAVLRFLANAGEAQRDVNGVAKFLNITPGPASRALSALENKGLIEGIYRPHDRRKRRMDITPEGNTMLKNDPIARLEQLIGELDQDTHATLHGVLKGLCAKMSK